jgi:hypothetical protein
LDPSKIEIPFAIDTVEDFVESIVGFEKSIAAPSFTQSVKIGEFQIVFADCIPEIAHRDVPSLGDAIEGDFDELVHRDAFRE